MDDSLTMDRSFSIIFACSYSVVEETRVLGSFLSPLHQQGGEDLSTRLSLKTVSVRELSVTGTSYKYQGLKKNDPSLLFIILSVSCFKKLLLFLFLKASRLIHSFSH
jgi:hypothetical protein